MAEICSTDIEGSDIMITLRVSNEEYELLKQKTGNLVVIPCGPDDLNQLLTTGRLGNSNRVMLPKRLLERKGVKTLQKKVPARIFKANGEIYLIIKLDDSQLGIPVFEEDV